jgi:hypothetical protein
LPQWLPTLSSGTKRAHHPKGATRPNPASGVRSGISLQARYAKTDTQSFAMLTTVHPRRAPTSVIGSGSANVAAVLT